MTRRRWIADEVSGNQAALTGAHAEHLGRVLRARVGQEFDLSTGNEVRRARITSIDHDRVEFDLGAIVSKSESLQVTIALSIFKFDRMEWAIEKCVELGVVRIIPVIARRTEVHLASASAKRIDRWLRIAKQAAEQSRRISPPEISQPLKFKDLVTLQASLRIMLSECEQETMLRDVLRSRPEGDDVLLAIGPEGGWTDSELQSFMEAGWTSASLGKTILRAETAAIAATAVVVSELNE